MYANQLEADVKGAIVLYRAMSYLTLDERAYYLLRDLLIRLTDESIAREFPWIPYSGVVMYCNLVWASFLVDPVKLYGEIE